MHVEHSTLHALSAPRPKPHRLVFGINDVALRNAPARAAASGLGLNQYAIPVSWKPGQKLSGTELGDIPRNRPVFAYLYGMGKDAPRSNTQRHAYANFARALVKRNPQIRELQVWNEPTVKGSWPGQHRIRNYMPLLATTYDRLRGSGVKVVAPGSYPGIAQQQAFVGAVRGYYKNTGRKRPLFDIYGSHPYWDWQKTSQVEQAMNRQWRGLPQASPQRGLKYWWTESGMESDAGTPSGPYKPPIGATRLNGTPAQQAQRIKTLVSAAERDPTIGALFNFLLYDEKDPTRWQSGLLTPTGQQKPAYSALQQMIAGARRRGY